MFLHISVLTFLEHCPNHMLTRRDVKSDPTQTVMSEPISQHYFIVYKLILNETPHWKMVVLLYDFALLVNHRFLVDHEMGVVSRYFKLYIWIWVRAGPPPSTFGLCGSMLVDCGVWCSSFCVAEGCACRGQVKLITFQKSVQKHSFRKSKIPSRKIACGKLCTVWPKLGNVH